METILYSSETPGLPDIVSNPEIVFGEPCITGTNITVNLLLYRLAKGDSEEAMLEDYPRMPVGSVQAAQEYAEKVEKGLLPEAWAPITGHQVPPLHQVFAGWTVEEIDDFTEAIREMRETVHCGESAMNPALLDTDTASEYLKSRNRNVDTHATDYARKVGPLTISVATRFEILRGYKHRSAVGKIAVFEAFCTTALIIPTTQDVWDLAAELWALGRTRGFAHTDTDLVIAATARIHQRTLVTGNTAHFAWIPRLTLVDWRQP